MRNNVKKITFFLFLFLINYCFALDCNQISIIQKPIVFNTQRIALTEDYRLHHYGIQSKSITISPKMIVLHWTATANLVDAFNDFYFPVVIKRPELMGFSSLNVSAHYLVDRDGKIYQLMLDNMMARHTIGLNNISIGIENVGGTKETPLTSEQINANVCLILFLKKKYPTIHYLIGHYEYLKFKNTPLWEDKFPGYITQKEDPGPAFMKAVRSLLPKNVEFQSSP